MQQINYAQEAGHLAGAFRFLSHDLVRKGLISYENAPEVDEIIKKMIEEAREKSSYSFPQ
jgi:intergrase/recombinase